MKNPLPKTAIFLAFSCLLAAASLGRAEKKAPEAELTAGYRGVTLPLSNHQLANLKSGDRVDMMVTFEAALAKGEKELVTATILQNVKVLAVDKSAGLLELSLNPNEAQYAVLAAEDDHKKIWVERRREDDVEMKPLEMASFRKLFR